MKQIIIEVEDAENAELLIKLLDNITFIHSVEIKDSEETQDFFSLRGIWSDRDITLEQIREKAWPTK